MTLDSAVSCLMDFLAPGVPSRPQAELPRLSQEKQSRFLILSRGRLPKRSPVIKAFFSENESTFASFQDRPPLFPSRLPRIGIRGPRSPPPVTHAVFIFLSWLGLSLLREIVSTNSPSPRLPPYIDPGDSSTTPQIPHLFKLLLSALSPSPSSPSHNRKFLLLRGYGSHTPFLCSSISPPAFPLSR